MKYSLVSYSMILFIFTQLLYANSHHPQEFLQSIKGSKTEGEQIFNHFCVNCHAAKPLIPLGAPKIGAADEWSERVKQGLDTLLQHTDEGVNAMPARGGCFECTNEQLILAILYMLPKESQEVFLNELKAHKKNTK